MDDERDNLRLEPTGMNSPRWGRLPTLLALVLIGNLCAGAWYHNRMLTQSGELESQVATRDMAAAIRLIRNQYVDADKIGYENLRTGAIEGMLSKLDPFSTYFTPTQYVDVEDQSRGEFGGIGVVISMEDGHLTIVRPMPEGPAVAAGLQAKDRIVAVDGEPLKATRLEEAVQRIKGLVGTTVRLTIHRPSSDESFEVTLERAIIPVPSVIDTSLIAEGIGFIRLLQFNEKTVGEFMQALAELDARQLKGLVIDLRYNPGGHLSAAVGVSSMLLEPNALVVYTEGRRALHRESQYASPPGPVIPLTSMPLVVLINGGSASASEIVAGGLGDHGRATLIGARSFGKGSVQMPLRLPSGSVMHLTTAHYYTPSRRVIHGQGIEPDLHVPLDPKAPPALYQTGPGAQNDPQLDLQLKIAITFLQQGMEAARAAVPAPPPDVAEDATADPDPEAMP